MKIIILSAKIDAEHEISIFLEQKGIALLFPTDSQEALEVLKIHNLSVDLVLIQLEDQEGPETGIPLIQEIKKNPTFSDLPIIVIADSWTESNCAAHQNSPNGVNGYLRMPFTPLQVFEMIQTILAVPALSVETPTVSSPLVLPVLEDGSAVFLKQEAESVADPTIFLESAVPDRSHTISLAEEMPLVAHPPAVEVVHSSAVEVVHSSAVEVVHSSAVEVVHSSAVEVADSSAVEVADSSAVEVEDHQAAQEMPYLFTGPQVPSPQKLAFDSALFFSEPLGDAVVPGGAAQAPDLVTLKKYLLLREQDVAILSNQLKAAQDQIKMTQQGIRDEKAKNVELVHTGNELRQRIADFDKEKDSALGSLRSEIEELRFQVKAKTDKSRVLENQVHETSEEMEHLKERVRIDIRKIRVREKELENRIEIIKKDSEALIGARENKIIELKRKLDLLEFNMDLLQDQYSKEKEKSSILKERLARAAQVVRVAGGLLDSSKGVGEGVLE